MAVESTLLPATIGTVTYPNAGLWTGGDSNPDTPSSDYEMMKAYWDAVETIMDGSPAVRRAGVLYLPSFPHESAIDYEYRRRNAMFSNIYRDIVEGLAAKPFAKEVILEDGTASEAVKELAEDIDGQGNNLHVFAAHVFFQGINDAIDWIFVDKPVVPLRASVAEEKAMGARPYWVHIPAKRMLAVYSDVIAGKEEIVHARIHEPDKIRTGWSERVVNRVRVLDRPSLPDGTYGPATWTLYEEVNQPNLPTNKTFIIVGQGPIAIGVISLVPFIVGRRKATTWQFVPPMQDALFLQIEHYQQETNLKSIKEQAAFPMLAGNGVTPVLDSGGKPKPVPTGPKSVLYAPSGTDGSTGSWTFIEPASTSLTFLAADVKATEEKLRELGRQPLTAQSGNMTVVGTAFAAAKGNSAIQAWALNLKDALEQAFLLTCLWMGDPSEPEVVVHTDFAIDLESDSAPNFLLELRKNKEISRKTILNEAQRRNYLAADFDEEEDMEEILDEEPAEPSPAELMAAAGGLVPGQPPKKTIPPKEQNDAT
jgi:hypothetical protein